MGSELSAASGRRSEASEWPRSKFSASAVRQRKNFGHRNRIIGPYEGLQGVRCGEESPSHGFAVPALFRQGSRGDGDADCHDQFANWSRNDMVYYGRKPPRWGVAYARGRRKCMYQILLVEDDRALALAVQKLLESYGSRVRCVEDFADVFGGVCRLSAAAGAYGH